MIEYRSRTKPYRHQMDYLRAAGDRRAFAVFSDMGTGKSKMIVDEVAGLHQQGLVDTVLITTSKGNYDTWPDEIRKHLDPGIEQMTVLWDGRDNMRSRELHRVFLECTDLRFLVVNIEALASSQRARIFVKRLLGTSKRRMTVVDESTLIKNHDAMRSRELVRLGCASEFRRIVTGNPTPNSPLDLWGQFEFLRGTGPGMLGFNSFYAFRARYAIMQSVNVGNHRTVQQPVAYRYTDELAERVAQHSFRVRKEECLDLPAKVYMPIRRVELTKDQSRIYEDMRKRAVAIINEAGDTVSVSQAIAVMIKLHQILCGQVMDDEGQSHHIPNNRIPAMLDVVRESGRQTIVWSAYRLGVSAIVAALQEEFGPTSVVQYHGGVGQDDRKLAIRRFQEGDAHFFVGTPHAGARGITLTAAKTVVYYSNTFNLEHRIQSEDRAHRIGQTDSVSYTDLCAGSLDMRLIESLRAKIDLSAAILRDGPREWLVPSAE